MTTVTLYMLALLSLVLAGCSAALSLWMARGKDKPWLIIWSGNLLVIGVIALANSETSLSTHPALSGLVHGYRDVFLLSLLAPSLLLIPGFRHPRKSVQWLLALTACALVLSRFSYPFIQTSRVRALLEARKTHMTADGVCMQSTGWTCGPATMVTLLRRLGLPAEEGEIATLSQSNPTWGTEPELMVEALNKHYANDRVSFSIQHAESISELQRKAPCAAVIDLSFLIGHFVAVLEVSEDTLVLGDPLKGRVVTSRREFERVYRGYCVVITPSRSSSSLPEPARR